MRKLFSLIAAVLFAGSMMAAEAIMQYTDGVTTNMVGDGGNNATTVGLDADLFTVIADKGANQNLPGLNKNNDIRLYADKNTGNGNIITVSIAEGTINSIVLDIKQNATFVVKAGETAVTEVDGEYAINATSFSIQNTTTGATTQLQLNKITIIYSPAGGNVPQTAADTLQAYIADMILIKEFIATFSPQAASSFDGYISGYQQVLQGENEERIRAAITEIDQQRPAFIGMVLSLGKQAMNTTLQALLQDGDSEACQQIISDAQDAINAINWDDSKSVEQNLTYLQNEGTRIYNDAVAALERARNPQATISCLEVYQKAQNDTVLLNPATVTYSNGAIVLVLD